LLGGFVSMCVSVCVPVMRVCVRGVRGVRDVWVWSEVRECVSARVSIPTPIGVRDHGFEVKNRLHTYLYIHG
jgi:hypothetical protein